MPEARSHESPVQEGNPRETRRCSAEAAILAVVARIPLGCVATYGQVAQIAGLPGRARLVGRVLASLPSQLFEAVPDKAAKRSSKAGPAIVHAQGIALTWPWHRVINAQGRIALPKASLSYVEQRRRLREEGLIFRKDRIDLRRHQWRASNESPLLD